MDQHLIFLLLGLANGAVFASLAMALVVTYRSSGVLNFATGTIALYGAYTYAFLRQGQLLVLIPGLPEKVDLGSDLSFWPATAADARHHRGARSAALPGRVPAAAGGARGGQGGGVDRRHGRHDRAHVAATGDRSRVRRRDPAHQRLDPRFHPDLERPRLVRGRGPRHRARDHGRLPLHPLRTAHPRRSRDRERSPRQRHRARSSRRPELDDQRRGRRDRRHPHRADRPARTRLLHAVHRPGARRRDTRTVPIRASSSCRWALHRDAAIGSDVLPEPAHLVAGLGTARAHPADPDPPGAGGAGQAAPESRRHPAAHPRSRAAPAAHPRADGAGNGGRRARPDPAAQQLARRDGDELHLRHHLPVTRRRDRLRRTGVAGTAHPGRRRRFPARDVDDGMVDPVPDRADPRGARRDRRRCDRRSPGDPRPWPVRRRGDARHGLRGAGRVVPQLRLRAGRRQEHHRPEALRARSPFASRHRLSRACRSAWSCSACW